MGNSARRDVERLLEECRAQGLRIESIKSGWKVFGKTTGIVVIHATPSDHRWLENTRARLRRYCGMV